MITILCSGSRGDFQPYIALAQEIKAQGYDVRISGSSDFQDFIESYGITCFPLKTSLSDLNVDPKLLEKAGSSDNPLKMLLAFNKMKKYGVYMVEDMYRACQGSDLIIYHPGCTIGYFAAQEMNIPAIMASPFPMHKTKEYLSVVMYGKSKPSRRNIAISYKMIQTMLWMASKPSVKSFLKKKNGTLPPDFGCPFENVSPRYPAIISCSNYVFPRPQDWDNNIHQKGYWFTQESTAYTPPKKLQDFLQQGEKPVYLGFGSMTALGDHHDLLQIAIDGLKKAGKRGIISGLSGSESLPDSICTIDAVPHSWLFPQMAAVCHHGGAGTTAAGFQAGVPSVIIPFSNDQFAWAHRAFDLKVGAPPIYKKKLTADALADAITFALQDQIITNAQRLGEKIATENGVKSAVEVVIGCLEAGRIGVSRK